MRTMAQFQLEGVRRSLEQGADQEMMADPCARLARNDGHADALHGGRTLVRAQIVLADPRPRLARDGGCGLLELALHHFSSSADKCM